MATGLLRLHLPEGLALAPGLEFDLPPAAARHAQVRRVQPGQWLRLFDGSAAGDWPAEVLAITRSTLRVRLAEQAVAAPAGELPWAVTLAFCMPANERMDGLVEKATELGAAALQPLMSERSVLRLIGERAERRQAHWQAVAAAACEQCGRARLPVVHPVRELSAWLRRPPPAAAARTLLLSTDPAAPPWARAWPQVQSGLVSELQARFQPGSQVQEPTLSDEAALAPTLRTQTQAAPADGAITLLSGPEGGFTAAEEAAARSAGFAPVSLGTRVLRADTAPLAALAWIALSHTTPKSG